MSSSRRSSPSCESAAARAALSMAVLTQLTIATIALLIGFLVFSDPQWSIYEILQASVSLILIVILCNRFLPFVFFSRTKGEWLIRWILVIKILIYLVRPVTIVLGFLQSVASLTRQNTSEEPESSTEAVDALIEAGQEEGIIQEGDRDLIQSVVEFSGKTVREAMKPRPQMFAVPIDTTVERFIEMLRAKHYSRVPVYEGSVHNIKGIVYAQDVLQVPDTEAHVRTLDTLMRRDVYFVPESKLGSDLLREMQKQNIRMAIVVDEYGGVAGLVTIEDLVEEIVGEIRDDHDKPRDRARRRALVHRFRRNGCRSSRRTFRHQARRERVGDHRRAGQRTRGTHSAQGRGRGGRRPALRSSGVHRPQSGARASDRRAAAAVETDMSQASRPRTLDLRP